MAAHLSGIETFVVVMMENRSFDHALGYLRLPPWNRHDIDGIQDDPRWIDRYTNMLNGAAYRPFRLQDLVIDDPPHGRDAIWRQMQQSVGAQGPMTGFVESYWRRSPAPKDVRDVMGYYVREDVPLFDFFAGNFLVCDRWFAALPTGTQPNRYMAMSGASPIDDNANFPLPEWDLVYDWLDAKGVNWCVYHDGSLPFFALMAKWLKRIPDDLLKDDLGLKPRFRYFEHMARDFQDDAAPLPPVIFVEPEYTDAPRVHHANDDHAPTPIDHGQTFLRDVYRAVTANPARWARTAMIVTYDENGGFFDHVSPPRIPTAPPAGVNYPPFETAGVRVPAFIVSPLVSPGRVFSGNLDHTSVLQLLAERFPTPGRDFYSDAVRARHEGPEGLVRLSQVFDLLGDARTDAPLPPPLPGDTPEDGPNVAPFRDASKSLRDDPNTAPQAGSALPELWWTTSS